MGKKGVLLDNGKAARSSMDLYWKAAQNKKKNNNTEKKQPREEDIEERAGQGKDKWKTHKEKMINKLFSKFDKKEKVDEKVQQEKQKKEEEEMERDLVEKEMNKNKPLKIAGFKSMEQLRSKMQFQQVKVGNNANNKLIPRSPAEQLSEDEIIQILREKKAKKQLQRVQKDRIEKNLKERQMQEDFMMNSLPLNNDQKAPEKKIEPAEEPEIVEEKPPETFFKSQILQKIERGEALHKKQQKMVEQQKQKEENPKQFASKFVPRALWNK